MSWRRELVGLLVVAACKSSDAPPKVTHDDAAAPRTVDLGPTPSQVVMEEPKLALPSVEAFQLLAPGATPQKALRYRLVNSVTTYTHTLALLERHTVGKGDFSDAAKIPEIRERFVVTPGDGVLALRILPTEVASASREADAALAAWRALENHTASVALDDRGQLGAVTVDAAAGRDELVERMLVGTIPLPAEPIGVGAKWRVITIYKQGPATAKQTATYTLTAPGRVHVAIRAVAEEQRVTVPGLPEGASVTLLAMLRTLEGDLPLDLAAPLVQSGVLRGEQHVHLRVARGPQTVERIIEGSSTMTLDARK